MAGLKGLRYETAAWSTHPNAGDHRDETDPATTFGLGVAYRARYDSPSREPGDFRRAVEHWERALASDPNQYIWRRRIQQYGPRLDKPYPFYDWVPEARAVTGVGLSVKCLTAIRNPDTAS